MRRRIHVSYEEEEDTQAVRGHFLLAVCKNRSV
jgi:hypothetical protein